MLFATGLREEDLDKPQVTVLTVDHQHKTSPVAMPELARAMPWLGKTVEVTRWE